ncbi:MAG: hypothetical protein Q8S73_37050 [Deltaproteobacteria bacterium]|nr:hypothetical protein [Myxococcales bacterium]MDP3219769.1 hypothetical protein [Deltaproteobacteria bacterium]
MKRRPSLAPATLDRVLLMALRYALPRTISTGAPDEEAITACLSQLAHLPEWALSEAVAECRQVDRDDAHAGGPMDSPTMRAQAWERRERFRVRVEAELERRAREGRS